jgi:hypothetical protein
MLFADCKRRQVSRGVEEDILHVGAGCDCGVLEVNEMVDVIQHHRETNEVPCGAVRVESSCFEGFGCTIDILHL